MNRSLRLLALCSLLSTSSFMVGCGDDRPVRVPVSGTVYYGDKPLTAGFVRFVPPGDRPATARIQPDGSFRLETYENYDGAVLGRHVVTVSAIDESNPGSFKSLIPDLYNDSNTSPLTEEITGPTEGIEIRLVAEVVAVDRRAAAGQGRTQSLRQQAVGGSASVPTAPSTPRPAPVETYDFSGDVDPDSQL